MDQSETLERSKKNYSGIMFLSKKSEMYLPNLWPSYFKSARCYKRFVITNLMLT